MSEQSPEKLNSSEAPAETYSLASILSEYKSEAFIRNERRLSKEELEKRADEIIREMKRSVEEELSEPEPSAQEPEAEGAPEEAQAEAPAPAEPLPSLSELAAADLLPDPPAEAPGNTDEPEPEPPAEAEREPAPQPREEENRETPPAAEAPQPEAQPQPEEPEPEPTAQPEESEEPEEAEEAEETEEPETPEEPDEPEPEEEKWPSPAEERKRQQREARAERARRKRQQREEKARLRKEAREKEPENVPELTAEEAAKQYASGVASLRRRMIPAFALSVVMALLLFLGGGSLGPEALRGGRTLWILQAAMQLAVMILGLDVLAKGVTDLLSAKPGCETVVLLANIAAEIDAVLMISGHGGEPGLPPYCVTAAFTLAFALWGSYCRRSAFRETIRAMRLASVPTVVSSEDKLAEEGSILNKKLGTAKGFLQRATEPDLPERFYHKAVPPCLLLLLVLALAAAYLSGTGAIFRCLAALSCAAAAMSATMVYARPFFLTAKRLSLSGAALAGWRGAEDMAKAVGLVIRDLDIYPENSVILNGMKVLSGAHVEKVVAYTGSVILATGSGLRRVFGELMRQYAAPLYRVEDFDCGTEGGVSAFIGAEQVLVGTGAYMNLMGIRVPGSVDVAGAVYTAIDHELCGVFIVNYLPQELVQNALYRLESGRMRPIFAIRDFNISPSMMIQKFRLNEGSISFLPPENRYQLSVEPETEGKPAALLSREGLWHYSETARGGRRLWRTTRRALLMTVLGSVLGVLIVFISCARGAFASVSPVKLLLAMLLWAFATLMIAESAEGD